MLRKAMRWGGVLTAGAAAGLAYLTSQVHAAAERDERRPADVIIVLGAAEYRGLPSPVLKSRLDHALALYRQGLAPRILTTGGSGGDPDFTEGEVGRNYLVRKGVPSEAILVEPEAETTFQSVLAAGEIMARMNLRSCLLVTDGYHLLRSKKMLEERGFAVYGSPRPGIRQSAVREWWLAARQAVGLLLWSARLRW
ncbi:MAG: YdcF family protein [Bryobacteraceae bacterium]|nr:YdcF family protein [Bryobacteraceae bacterium]